MTTKRHNKFLESTPKNKIELNAKLTLVARTLLIILITYFQMLGFIYYIEPDTVNWIFFAAIFIPLLLMNIYFAKSFFKTKHTLQEIIGLFLLALAFYTGLFLPYLNSFGLKYIKAAMGYVALFFVMGYLANELLFKVKWEYRQRKPGIIRFLIYFLVPAGAYTLFLIACYPGLISPDSVYILGKAAQGGPYDNLSPLLYTLIIRLLTLVGFKLGGMMILQCLMCALAYAYIAYSFDKMGLPVIFCIIGIILLAIYPMNLMTNITMWKDIPYTIGVSVIIIELIKIISEEKYFKSKMNLTILVIALIITLIARHNGIVVVVVTFLVGCLIFLFKKNFQYAFTFGIIIAASVTFYCVSLFGSIWILGDKYQEPTETNVTDTAFYALRIQGLIAVYHDKWDSLSQENKDFIDKYLDLDEVDGHIEKYETTWRYRSRTKIYVDINALLDDSKNFNKGYIKLLKEYPFEVINAYIKTTGIVWAAPSYGYTMHAAYPHEAYDTSLYENLDLQIKNYMPKMKQYITDEWFWKLTRDENYAIFWRPASFMLILLLFLYHSLRKKGGIAWIVAVPAIANSLCYLVVNEAQDARYVYINFTAALIMIAFAMMKKSSVGQ